MRPTVLGRAVPLGVLLFACLPHTSWSAGKPEPRDAVVKVFATRLLSQNGAPWRPGYPSAVSGSGFVIEGRRILTNAHVVRDATFVQVRRHGDAERATARVLHVSHEADLALLTVDKAGFFEGITPLEIGGLPGLREEVVVVGFPVGGDTLSITRGVVSRIEHQTYAHSHLSLLAGQIDSAVNAGNSGGPVLGNGRVVGVAMQGNTTADNIAYMVPGPVVKRFLTDVADGRYDGVPATGLRWQRLEAADLRRLYGLPASGGGVLVLQTAIGSAAARAFQVGDVLLAIDGHAIGPDGTVEFRKNERTRFELLIQQRQVNDHVSVDLFRDGETHEVDLVLDHSLENEQLVPGPAVAQQSYFIFGGLAFCPLTASYLKAWREWQRNAPRHLVSQLSRFPSFEGEQKVRPLRADAGGRERRLPGPGGEPDRRGGRRAGAEPPAPRRDHRVEGAGPAPSRDARRQADRRRPGARASARAAQPGALQPTSRPLRRSGIAQRNHPVALGRGRPRPVAARQRPDRPTP